jgi:HK97 family phage major capsid protein
MSDLNEIQKAIEASNKSFEDFKALNEKSLKEVASGNAARADELKKQMEGYFTEVQAMKTVIETLEAKAKRPAILSVNGQPINETEAEHKAAFFGPNGFMRKGNENGLMALEQKAMAWSTSAGADGGYAVPKVIDPAIAALAVNISPIRQLAEVVQVSTPQYHKLMNLRGTASGWVAETAARTATTSPTMADIQPTFGELYANLQITQQLLDDAFFNVEQWAAEQITTEFARAEGAAFITGNGTNQPTGFLAGTPLATADGVRAFGTIQYTPTGVAGNWAASNPGDSLITLVSQMKAAYRQGSTFVTNKAALFAIAAFKDSGGRYIFNPIAQPGVPQTILNYPVVEAEDMPAIAANSFSVAFGNFKQGYLIADRIGMRMLRDPFSNKPYIGFYVTKRLGGIVTNSEAIKVLKFAVS